MARLGRRPLVSSNPVVSEPPKYIFVTGGVASGLGKGITTASLARLLKSRGFKLTLQKLDPYTDVDLGHYERFTDESLHRGSNVTTGSVYQVVISKERRGEFLGRTVQVIPHITNEIKDRIRKLAAAESADITIVEVGGTVGDIEGLPFLEAIRQLRNEVGRDNVAFVHLSLTPFIGPTGELKTKPTQHSVRELRSIGIQPDVIVCRSDRPISRHLKEKISLLCDVPVAGVISAVDADSIYEVPLVLHDEGLDDYLVRLLHLPETPPDLTEWQALVDRVDRADQPVDIRIVGKYVNLRDAYLSVIEALKHGGFFHGGRVDLTWVASDELVSGGVEEALAGADGILVPGGFGIRGVAGKIEAA